MGKRTETIEIVGKDSTSGLFKGIGQSLKDLNKAAREAGVAGESSIFGLLKGGGAAAGITMAANALKSGASEARRLVNELRGGAISTGDLVEAAAAAVPIYGQVWSAGREIRGTIQDAAAAWLQMNGAAETTVRVWESGEKSLKRATDEAEFLAGLHAKFRAEVGPSSDRRLIGKRGADYDIAAAKLAGKRRDDAIVDDRALVRRAVASGLMDKSGESAELKAIAQREIANIENTKRNVAEIEKKYLVQRQNDAAASARRIADINAAASEAELRAMGMKYQAEASVIRRGAEQAEEAIKSAYRTKSLNLGPEDAKRLLEQSRAEITAIRSKMAADLNAANTEAARKNWEDRQKMQEDLQREAEREMERQKQEAEKIRGHATGGVAPISSRFVTGAGAAAREGTTERTAVKIEKNTGDTADGIKDLARAIRENPNNIIFGIGL